jgi:hypothetical protein
MFRHRVTVALAASLPGALGTFGIALASGAATDRQRGGQRSVTVAGGDDAGNGSAYLDPAVRVVTVVMAVTAAMAVPRARREWCSW